MTRAAKGNNMRDARKADGRYEAALRLFGALSGVEEDYLEACETDEGAVSGRGGAFSDTAVSGGMAAEGQQPSGMLYFIWKYGKAMAAVLCAAVLGVSYLGFQLSVFSGGTKSAPSEAFGIQNGAKDAGYDSVAETCMVKEECSEEEDLALSDQVPAACEEVGASVEGTATGTEQMSVASNVTEDEACKDLSNYQGNPGGKQEQEKQQGQQGTGERADNIEQDVTVDKEGTGCPQDVRREMTPDEAKALAVVGEYLPTAWPADGRLKEVRGDDTDGQESVVMSWIYGNGWDSFTVTVANLGDTLPAGVQESLADLSKPETFDQRRYEIPYAGSVPPEYHSVFQNPVFREEDFARECVEARILANTGDSGDTDTPRGNFGVLYRTETGAYVLARFSGRGSADEIWSLMQSIH